MFYIKLLYGSCGTVYKIDINLNFAKYYILYSCFYTRFTLRNRDISERISFASFPLHIRFHVKKLRSVSSKTEELVVQLTVLQVSC